MFIQRTIALHIQEMAQYFPIISLTGPRQAGKTTLLRTLFPQYEYISLEAPDMRQFAQEDPRRFLKRYSQFVIIDEAQRVPELFSYLQTKVDEDKIMGQYILSGSQNFLLLESISQSLAGRVAICRLFPFTLDELQPHFTLSADEYMFQGAYPVMYDRGMKPALYYPNYIETYIERDIREMIQVRDLSAFRRFVKLCAGRAGQLLNLNALSVECGISQPTARAWLSILETSYLVFVLQPYHKNFNKRLVKTPKLYFYDTGLLCNLLGIQDVTQLEQHYLRGNIFENMVISELYKGKYHENNSHQFWFWRDNHQHEIDLLIESGMTLKAIEIKSGQTIHSDFFKGLIHWQNFSTQTAEMCYLVYGGTERYQREYGKVVSWQHLKVE